jgi:hypothetical protein
MTSENDKNENIYKVNQTKGKWKKRVLNLNIEKIDEIYIVNKFKRYDSNHLELRIWLWETHKHWNR